MNLKRHIRIQIQRQLFLRIGFTYSKIIYFNINCLCGLSSKIVHFSLFCRVRVEARFLLENPFIGFLYVVIQVINCSHGCFNSRKQGSVTAQKRSLPLRISLVNVTESDLVTFTEEILNVKLHFLCSVSSVNN